MAKFKSDPKSDDNEVWSNLPHTSATRKGPSKRLGPAKVRSENKAKVGNDDLTPRSNLPDKNAVEQKWERKKAKDSNPALTKQYAKDKRVTDVIYGSNSEKARRNGWQYENGEKNHHKRGEKVRTNDSPESAYSKNYAKGGAVRGCGCAVKGKGFRA